MDFLFYSGDDFDKHQQAYKGRGRGTSLNRENVQVTSPNGIGKPFGE